MSSHETLSDENAPRHERLRLLVILQVFLIFVSAGIFSYVGWKIKPMIQRERQLEQDITEKARQSEALEHQIAVSTSVLRQLNLAIATSSDKSLKQKTEQIQISPLTGYKLGIYYLGDDATAASRAQALQTMLSGAHYPGTIALNAKPRSFFSQFGEPDGDEIRYELDYESAQAQALLQLLHDVDSQHAYKLRIVENRTVNFLSVFLADGL